MSAITTSWAKTMQELGDTFAKWDVAEWDVRPMRELDKRAHWQGEPATVTVRFVLRGDHINLDCASQQYYFQNFRVLYFAIEAMRLNEVRGLTTIMRDAYAQLAAPKVSRDPWEVLGIRPDAGIEVAEAAYRAKAKMLHPDAGGDAEGMAELNAAIETVRAAS